MLVIQVCIKCNVKNAWFCSTVGVGKQCTLLFLLLTIFCTMPCVDNSYLAGFVKDLNDHGNYLDAFVWYVKWQRQRSLAIRTTFFISNLIPSFALIDFTECCKTYLNFISLFGYFRNQTIFPQWIKLPGWCFHQISTFT